MKTLTVKIPEALNRQLRRKAKAGQESISEIVRRALVRELEPDAGHFATLAEPFRGMISGAADLSSREGYGPRDPR